MNMNRVDIVWQYCLFFERYMKGKRFLFSVSILGKSIIYLLIEVGKFKLADNTRSCCAIIVLPKSNKILSPLFS